MWNQIYNPLGNAALSTIAAALPVVTLLVLIASGKVKAHIHRRPLEEINRIFAELRAGTVDGRIVIPFG